MKRIVLIVGLLLVMVTVGVAGWFATRPRWTEEELAILRGLSIDALPALPKDPSNRYGDDLAAARFGQALFFDTRLSSNGEVSCASCHQPDRSFTDGLALGEGLGTAGRKTMNIIGTAYSPWQFWDGRKDSQWAQALGPLESAVEHGGDRTFYARTIAQEYADQYQSIFGSLPDLSDQDRFPLNAGPVDDPLVNAAWEAMTQEDRDIVTQIFVNMGKAIAAYERRLLPGTTRFDLYVRAAIANDRTEMDRQMNEQEVAGLRLFIGRANCTQCHNGPLFTNNDFHNTGVPAVIGKAPDRGRADGVTQLLSDEFNCLGRWSDAGAGDCDELKFAIVEGEQLVGAFKPSSLRNITLTAPYMHAGQFASLDEVLMHYNHAPMAAVGHSELVPLHINRFEREDIIAFLATLEGGTSAGPEWLAAP